MCSVDIPSNRELCAICVDVNSDCYAAVQIGRITGLARLSVCPASAANAKQRGVEEVLVWTFNVTRGRTNKSVTPILSRIAEKYIRCS